MTWACHQSHFIFHSNFSYNQQNSNIKNSLFSDILPQCGPVPGLLQKERWNMAYTGRRTAGFLYHRIFANFYRQFIQTSQTLLFKKFCFYTALLFLFFWTTSNLFILVDLIFAGNLVCNALFADLVFLKIYSLLHSWHYFSVQILYNNQRSGFSSSDEQIWRMFYNIVLLIEQIRATVINSGMQSKLLQPLTVLYRSWEFPLWTVLL
jgi:hypothetical protein